ncbi:MAG: hypothetical protein PVJ09_02050 [Candidatus Woesebacteria bacterium]|jgi:hypothetical protein
MSEKEALIIESHNACQLRCCHCRGKSPTSDFIDVITKTDLANMIPVEALMQLLTRMSEQELLSHFAAIRLAGTCEPTLHPELPSIIEGLLSTTSDQEQCEICLITNGVSFPSGVYDENEMERFFQSRFGFKASPKNFILIFSADPEHLASYQLRRKTIARITQQQARAEYKQIISNLITYFGSKNVLAQLRFNAVKPMTKDEEEYRQMIRRMFSIPDPIRVDLLRKAIYAPRQETLLNAVDLRDSIEPPSNRERCWFLTQVDGELVVYPSIAAKGYGLNAYTVEDFMEAIA